jgi:hypothetical protein
VTEDTMLDAITAEQYLAKLNEERRTVLMLTEGYAVPDDWTKGDVTFSAIGRYIGNRFRGAPLSEAAVRYIRDRSLEMLNPSLVKNPKKTTKQRKRKPKKL